MPASRIVQLAGVEFDVRFHDDEIPTSNVDCLFLMHGRLEDKATRANERDRLVKETNMLVVTFDNPNHGGRLVDEASNKGWEQGNGTHAVDMYAQMVQAVNDLSVAIDLLPGKLGMATPFARVVVSGISQGGHAALLAASMLPRLDVCVAFIGSGDYQHNMDLRYARMVKRAERKGLPSPPPFESFYPASLKNTVEMRDPIRNVDKIARVGSALLMLNGQDDNLVPLTCNERFLAKLQPLYKHANIESKVKLVSMPGVKHQVTTEMLDVAVMWINKWVGKSTNSPL